MTTPIPGTPWLPRIAAAALAVSLAGGYAVWAMAAPLPAAQNTAVRTVGIPVQGMTCISCAARIKQHVKALPGVSNVEVVLAKRVVRVTYAANQPNLPSRAVASINALGYKAGSPVSAR